jgi:uncharacterized protein YkwD
MRSRLALCLLALLPTASFAQSLAEQVLEQVNAARWSNGQLAPLKGHAQLDAAALLHSTNMGVRNFFMHCDPDTLTSPGARMSAAGYAASGWAENIAAGSSTAAGVMEQWMGSAGHRANILGTSNNELGIGYYFDASDNAPKRRSLANNCTVDSSFTGALTHYWTQNFGRRSNNYPVVIAREAYRTTSCSVPLYLYGSGFATQMRLSNAGGTWTAWQAFATNTTWTMSGVNGGVATVNVEIRNAGGTVRSASDSIRLGTTCLAAQPDPNRIFRAGFELGE